MVSVFESQIKNGCVGGQPVACLGDDRRRQFRRACDPVFWFQNPQGAYMLHVACCMMHIVFDCRLFMLPRRQLNHQILKSSTDIADQG